MKIGYACLTVGVPGTQHRTCAMKSVTPNVLTGLIQSNLDALDHILDYNIRNGIKLFRISSDIITFGSHPINTVKWWEVFKDQLDAIGQKAKANGLRLSMHPGQYTVLNSPDAEVVERAVDDLRYHTRFLDALGLSREHKIILHIGGIYGDKSAAIERFIRQYGRLDENIRRRLIIENDDRQYTVSDVLSIGQGQGIPVVFDNLHHEINPDPSHSMRKWIALCAGTWKTEDGPQKMHYSQQEPGRRPGSHSDTLDVDQFLQYYEEIRDSGSDVMLEVKDKNLSAVKCINALASPDIRRLETEWAHYRHLVLEHSPEAHRRICRLLEKRSDYPVREFYRLIDEALKAPVTPANAVMAARELWDSLKESSDPKTARSFEKNIAKISEGGSSIPLKRLLCELAEKELRPDLQNCLYLLA